MYLIFCFLVSFSLIECKTYFAMEVNRFQEQVGCRTKTICEIKSVPNTY